jgi:chromate reductase
LPEAYKDENRPVTMVLISGSLRARSVNGAVVETAAKLLPAGARAVVYRRLADLTHFNPDEDRDPLPEPVAEMRELIRAADAVLFSTPEYAGSLPGSFKNLLDWTVGGSCIYCLPVSWINPSAHGGSQDTYTALRIAAVPCFEVRKDVQVAECPADNVVLDSIWPSLSCACRRRAVAPDAERGPAVG